ncbi:MAG: hypothetical protein KME17_21825 [Cyanosarcina radialis HA8281-LM2]|jgi:hypothetical protein|nr:hypothetical protein [Cyanosarcina radialis HA8281-LM2]
MQMQNNHSTLTQSTNPTISPWLRWVSAIEIVVLLAAGALLFFITDLRNPWWVWKITPYNTRFLGAVYIASLVPIAGLLWARRWRMARLVLSMQLVFTAVLLVVSLLYLDRFNLSRKIVWGWFFLYTTIPLNAAYHLWVYRHLSRWNTTSVSWRSRNSSRLFLVIPAVVSGLYGLGLLLLPNVFSAFWPWKLDSFHGQLYSSIFLTLAVAGGILSRTPTKTESLVLGITQITLGGLAILGTAIADTTLRKISWSVPSTWLWLALFGLMAVAGGITVWRSRQLNAT